MSNGLSRRSRLRRAFLRRAWLGAALGLVACLGYQFVDERGVLGPELRTIQFRTLENRTTETGFEALLADSLREEFVRRGALVPVLSDAPNRAPFALSGSVASSAVKTGAFSSVALTLEDVIEVSVSLQIARGGSIVWENNALRGSERFLASPDPQVYASNKEQALRRIASGLAQQVHDGLFQALVFQPQPPE
jgi:hypothetical protein